VQKKNSFSKRFSKTIDVAFTHRFENGEKDLKKLYEPVRIQPAINHKKYCIANFLLLVL